MTRTRLLRIERGALLLLVLLYIIIGYAHTRLAPLTTGPDELAHYEYVNFIANQGHLPLTTAEREQAAYKSDQPPLYHIITALPAAMVDVDGPPYLKRYSDHERRPLIEQTRHAWGLHNTEDETPPYRSAILRWHVGRWVSILFGAATVIVTYFIARGIPFYPFLPRTERTPYFSAQQAVNQIFLALSAAAVVAFVPRFTLTGSMLNYETMLAFFAALFLLCLLKIENLEFRMQNTTVQAKSQKNFFILHSLFFILLGLFAGLAITTKLSALILPLEIVVALGLIARHYGWPWTRWLRAVAITAAATFVTVSWWFGFVIYQFNTVAEDGLWTGLLRPLIAADASDATTNQLLSFLTSGQAGFTAAIDNLNSGPPWEWLAIMFRTFWTVGIEGQQPLGLTGLLIALALCLLAAWGLIRLWRLAASHQPSAINLQPPISNLQSPTSNLQSPTPNLQPPISNLQSPISNLQSPISNLQSPISNYSSPSSFSTSLSPSSSPLSVMPPPLAWPIRLKAAIFYFSPLPPSLFYWCGDCHQSPISNLQSSGFSLSCPLASFSSGAWPNSTQCRGLICRLYRYAQQRSRPR